MPNANNIAGLQYIVTSNRLAADDRAVAAFEIAQDPALLRIKNFSVRATATLVFDHDLVRGGTPNGHRLSSHKPEHVGPLSAFTNDQIR